MWNGILDSLVLANLSRKQFLLQTCQPNHILHYLLNKRDSIMYNLRNASKYHCPIPKTERYKGSFIVHNLLQQ